MELKEFLDKFTLAVKLVEKAQWEVDEYCLASWEYSEKGQQAIAIIGELNSLLETQGSVFLIFWDSMSNQYVLG
jgi:hypothetical protein